MPPRHYPTRIDVEVVGVRRIGLKSGIRKILRIQNERREFASTDQHDTDPRLGKLLTPFDNYGTTRGARSSGRTNVSCRDECYVERGVLKQCLTSESGPRNNRAAMITAISKSLDTCAATGCYSPSWSHMLLGQFLPEVNTIEF
jgi:hypothetical protein